MSTWLAFTSEPAHLPAGAWLASRYAGLGAPGAAIKAASSAGERGAGPLINDALSDDAEYWWWVTTPPASGTLVHNEDGQATLTVPGDGVYSWAYALKENGVLLPGPRAVVAVVGAAPATYNLTVPGAASASVLASPAIGYVPPGGATYSLAATSTISASALASPGITYVPPASTTYNLQPNATVSISALASVPVVFLGDAEWTTAPRRSIARGTVRKTLRGFIA